METAIARANGNMTFEDMQKQAALIVKSGFLPPQINSAEKALTIMLTGKELGLGLMESLRSINVVQGRPCMAAQLILGLCHRTGQVEDCKIVEEAGKCSVMLKRKGQSPYTSVFTMEDAKKLGLANKDNWIKQPQNMLKWRAISAACRVVFPDAISGIYTPEEISDNLPEVQEVKEAHIEAKPSCENADLDPKNIPDEKLGEWIVPFGKAKGLMLKEALNKETSTNPAAGLEYLQWCAESEKVAPEYREIISRFLKVMELA